MKKGQYKNQNNKDYKKFLVVLFVVMIFVLSLFNLILNKLKSNFDEQNEITYDSISSIKEVIEYYKSTYISENDSDESGYSIDAYVKFKIDLYENDESNEEYFNNIINDCAKVINYKSFKLIDRDKNITIKVICKNSKIDTILINDIEDYFIYMDSQISLKKYTEITKTNFTVNSDILAKCINNNWNSSDINFGERDSIFEEYYIYFDEGYRVRTIDDKVYNIVFTENYSDSVINGISVGFDFTTIEAKLGEATFSNDDETLIGYKGENMYVFFSEDEISIYRTTQTSSDDFFKLADSFINEELDLLEFMNQLTYLWPDYSDYEYTTTSVFIAYPLKGIEIKINYDDTNGILVYNNIKSTLSKVSRYVENTDFVARLQSDAVFEAEKRRFEKDSTILDKAKEYRNSLSEEEQQLIGDSMLYAIYPEIDNYGYIYTMNFISKFGANPNRELNDSITSYLWLSNEYFLYSKQGKGIYFYNLNNGNVQRIISGNGEFELKGYENNILKYDDVETRLDF